MITQEEFEKVMKDAELLGTQVGFINKNLQPFLNIFHDSFYIEAKNYKANEEVRKLFRFNDTDIQEQKDGISIPQMGYSGFIKKMAEKSLKNGDHDTWHSEKAIKQSLKGIDRGLQSSKGIVFFNTASNDIQDWFRTGEDYVRISLALAKYDIFSHPYVQPTQEYADLDTQREKLHQLLNVKEGGKTQLIMRIGRSDESYYSWRQSLENKLISK